jgi:imidazolonepropionase-like amidohydrolase
MIGAVSVAYRAARLFDGRSEHVVRDGTVVVDGDLIAYAGPTSGAPQAAETVDLGDATLLPGLIDAHVHLVWSAGRLPHALVAEESEALTVLRCAVNLRRQLAAGVTTVRDVGSSRGVAIDMARAVELGLTAGPRIVAAGRAMAMTGGHAHYLGSEVDGADEVRKAVRQEIKRGAGCIKLMASGGVYGASEEVGNPQLTVEEMRAGVDEAHKAGRKVTAHAYSQAAVGNALEAGVDCLEHGSFLERDQVDRIARDGVWLVPTLSVYQAMYAAGDELGTPDYLQRKTEQVIRASRDSFRSVLEGGVRVAAGTDCGAPGHPHGVIAHELQAMVEYGATPLQALRAVTANAAELLDVDAEVGTLEAGKRADLVAVAEDPLSEIRAVSAVRLVVQAGRPL